MHMTLNWCFTRVLIDAIGFNRCFIISSFNLAALQHFFKKRQNRRYYHFKLKFLFTEGDTLLLACLSFYLFCPSVHPSVYVVCMYGLFLSVCRLFNSSGALFFFVYTYCFSQAIQCQWCFVHHVFFSQAVQCQCGALFIIYYVFFSQAIQCQWCFVHVP